MRYLLFVADRKFSQAVVEYTRMLAELAEAKVTIHYVCKSSKRREAEEVVEKARSTLGDFVEDTRIDEGEIVESLVNEIERGGYDLVLVGARRAVSYWQRKLSSLSLKVIKRSTVPVLVVREPREQLENALVCTGGLEEMEARISFAGTFLQHTSVQADLLYVSGMVPSMYTGLDEMDEDLSQMLDAGTPLAQHLKRGAEILADSDVAGDVHLRHGTVVETILKQAKEGNYDLIVLGQTAVDQSVQGFLMGNVMRQVIENAHCPVLVVR